MPDTVTIAQARSQLVDPHDCTDAKDALTVLGAVFDTLVTRVPDGFAPGLAVHWTANDKAMDWRFQLRPGVKFHDGHPCDAEAVVRSLKRMARPDKGYTLGAPGVWHQYLGKARIVAEGALTVSIRLDVPVADLLDILVQGFIASPASLAALDVGELVWVGTGPFAVTAAGQGAIEVQRTQVHFGGKPKAQAVIWQAVSGAEARLEKLRSGAVQVATELDWARSAVLTDAMTRHVALDPVAIIFLLNAAKGPLTDARIRLALSLAMDREAVVKGVLSDAARPLYGVVSPLHFGSGNRVTPFNQERARMLLREAGFADGLTLTVDCPTSLPAEAEALTAELGRQLAEVGVTLDVTRHEDREEYAHLVRRKEIGDLCVFDSSPLSTFRVLYEKIDSRIAGSWWQGYQNVAVEQLLDAARAQTDQAARAATYRNIYLRLQDDPPWLTLYNPLRVTGLRGIHPEFRLSPEGVLDVRRLPAFG